MCHSVLSFVYVTFAGTRLKYKPGIIMGGKNLVHSCALTRSMGYYLEPLLVLGLFGKKPLSIRLKGKYFSTKKTILSLACRLIMYNSFGKRRKLCFRSIMMERANIYLCRSNG